MLEPAPRETRAQPAGGAGPEHPAVSRPWRCATLHARASLDSLGIIAGYLRAVCERGDVGKDAALRMRLAVEELTANAIVHGYRDRDDGRLVLIGGGNGRGGVSVQLRDCAPPFDPRARPAAPRLDAPVKDRPIGGLGIHLALTCLDEYRYERVSGQNRSTLTVWRRAEEN